MRFVLQLFLLIAICAPAFAQESAKTSQAQLPYHTAEARKDEPKSHPEQTMYPSEIKSIPTNQGEAPKAARDATPEVQSNLAWGVLVFSLLALCIEAVVVVKAIKPWSPQSILRVFGITFIVPMAVLLIVAGYSETQISPVIGLLGVIAGYLLGNNEKSRASA